MERDERDEPEREAWSEPQIRIPRTSGDLVGATGEVVAVEEVVRQMDAANSSP
jgi:hypothetical protein